MQLARVHGNCVEARSGFTRVPDNGCYALAAESRPIYAIAAVTSSAATTLARRQHRDAAAEFRTPRHKSPGPHSLQRLISPFRVLMSTRPLPPPSLNFSSRPGVYLLVRTGSGPKQLSISPLNVSMSKRAETGPSNSISTSPLIVSALRRPPSSRRARKTISPLVVFRTHSR
jgi:hypothetical protein